MLEKFLKNAKEYIDYLMKVNFRDLFVNTVILLCIIVLSALICIPLGRFEDLNTFKEQVKGNETKKVTLKKNNSKNGEMEELELPKAKSN